MRILVTGGAGYIGSHTCVKLLEAGYEVIVVDNFINSSQESLNRISMLTGKDLKVYEIDLLNKEALEKVFYENKIEAVIHFAGLKAVGESVALPLIYYSNNVIGTINLCEVMEKYGVYKMVFSSSATVYGVEEAVPFTEEMRLQATNPYGRSKLIIEEILRDLHTANKRWSIALLRYFNPIGAHSSGMLGEDPNGIPNNLTPYITKVAIGKLKELNIFGNDYPTHDGTGIRDYIHVEDLAEGHLKALEKTLRDTGTEAYNLGTGIGYSVLEVVEACKKASGLSIPYKIVDRRPGDIAVSYADTTKAKNELGWQAVRGLEDMCRDSWNWQLNNPDGYKTAQAYQWMK